MTPIKNNLKLLTQYFCKLPYKVKYNTPITIEEISIWNHTLNV
jgi:hypothetical protein